MANEQICSITLEVINIPHTLLCGHIFENDAIQVWLARTNTCPLCRDYYNINEESTNQLELFFSSLNNTKAKFVADILEGLSEMSLRFIFRTVEHYIYMDFHAKYNYMMYLMFYKKRGFDIFKRSNHIYIQVNINKKKHYYNNFSIALFQMVN